MSANILVLGGTGFVGRHLVKYLVDNKLAAKIRVADKQLPVTAYLSPEFKAVFDNPIVEFKQMNLSSPANAKKIFVVENDAFKFDYVVNLAAETRYGQEESVYKQHVFELSVNCAKEAAAHGVKKYIELSTAMIYEAGKKASKEDSKQKPWTKLAKYKQQAEQELKKIQGLPLIVLRTATIYGPGDLNGLAPRILCAMTYTHSKDKMKLLWSGDMRIDVVNVHDVVRAIWHCWTKANTGDVFNLADKTELTQQKLNTLFEDIFGIETGFLGSILSNLASINMKAAAEHANETHMSPWGDMLKNSGIKTTPLSPYTDVELLYNTSLSVDGSAIEKTGFQYEKPQLNKDGILSFLDYWTSLKYLPAFTKIEKK